jgi:hypothetical protein
MKTNIIATLIHQYFVVSLYDTIQALVRILFYNLFHLDFPVFFHHETPQ